MVTSTLISTAAVVTFVPINDAGKAIAFYRDLLGLTLVEDQSPFALIFDLDGIMLRATFVGEFKPQVFTILGWDVDDIAASVTELKEAGVTFLRIAGMNDDHPLAIWTAPGGAQIAWFHDPFGNGLSLTQFPG